MDTELATTGRMTQEDTGLVLANRAFLWGLAARGIADAPDEAFLEVLSSAHAQEEVGLVETPSSSQLVDAFAEVIDAAKSTGHKTLSQLYTDIFIGPHELAAPPWESVMRTGKRVLFQPEVLDVRESYRAAGFLPAGYPHVGDDFIGTECDFLAKLAERAFRASEVEDREQATRALAASAEFLDTHLGVWAEDFAEKARLEYEGCFYSRFAAFVAALCEHDAHLLGSLQGNLWV